MTKRGGHVEINCHGHGIVPDDRLFYTADSTSYNESASSSTIKYETRYYYIRER